MAMEVTCGQCSGLLLIETPGVVVACPHCGVHLSIPAPESAVDAPPPAVSEVNAIVADPGFVESAGAALATGLPNPFVPAPSIPQPVSSIFHGAESEHPQPNAPSDLGWPSSPNLSLADAGAQILSTNQLREADKSSAQPELSWMAAAEAPSAPAPAAVPQFSFGAPTPATSPMTGQVGWPDSSVPPSTAIPQPNPAVIAASPAPAAAVGAPDFNWMQPTNASPAQTPAPQFSFGASPAPNHALVQQSAVSLGPPAATFPANSPSASHTAPVFPQQAAAGIPSFAGFGQPHQAPAASDRASFTAPRASPPAPAFDLTSFAAPDALSSVPTDQYRPSPSREASAPAGTPTQADAQMQMVLLIVGSYASLLTIYLLYSLFFGRKNQLESLPDLKTVQQLGGRASVPTLENDLPPGHDLRIGQTQRFGNIRVTPLRVTRGSIAFKHYSGNKSNDRSPSDPVLKLWLKFENVSSGQSSITPLDTTLMFFHRVVEDRVLSYNAIFRAADRKKKKAQVYYLFDRMAADSEWTMIGQHTNEALEPGQSFETFVPSQENIDDLTGNIVWRVHIRKGHGYSGNGVTTLIDVHFNSDNIKSEST